MKFDPIMHTHATDELPINHKYSAGAVCEDCNRLLHAANNECMVTWVESEQGNYCLKCFYERFEMIYPTCHKPTRLQGAPI